MQTIGRCNLKNTSLALLFILSGCSTNGIKPAQNSIKILPATSYLIAKASAFVLDYGMGTSLRESKFDPSNFLSKELIEVRLTIGDQVSSAYGIISSGNPEIALIINFDGGGNVTSSLFSENIALSPNSAETKIYDLDGNLHLDFTTVGKTVTFHAVPSMDNSRTASWWSSTGDCISTAAQPFKNGALNLAFDVAASVVTAGWYPFTLAAACGIRSAL